ncbi:DUF1365 domain-containing protein [Paracoccus sp. (in: a-proteobacteria)]|uniref:DUF1365 domain-containing protein n=1 Tax=Paracoccus sp. TaxID=267 RepID=UPI0026E0A7CD|nr:DUF1365 domain-containing protein [Paracoccus sp. (in: a-proteobacteria)]MDO5648897.1 DUF1365 domain-containing protein [Paracoccus sp. (in: a-proteobacteria)]
MQGNAVNIWDGALIDGAVWHGRRGDAARDFRYRATYLAVPVARLAQMERGWPWRIRARDYGMAQIIEMLGPGEVTLITLPRSSGYGFNPVSFWMLRRDGALRAVLAEVSNTFGERHSYLIRHPDDAPITRSDRITAEKRFHVSPFLPRAGEYVFRFDTTPGRFGAWIDWRGDGRSLGTSLTGPARALTPVSLRRAAWRAPFQAQRVMALIHWQAAKLYARGVRYRTKPPQLTQTHSTADRTTDV